MLLNFDSSFLITSRSSGEQESLNMASFGALHMVSCKGISLTRVGEFYCKGELLLLSFFVSFYCLCFGGFFFSFS